MPSMDEHHNLLVSAPAGSLARESAPATVQGCNHPRRPLSAWRMAGVAMAGLLAGAADAPRTPQEALAHAQAAVSQQMRDMGVDANVFYGLQTVEMPRTYGPPGLAVCGSTMDADPRPLFWVLNFVAFYEQGESGGSWTMGDIMYERTDGDGTSSADLCEGALDPARGHATPEEQTAAGRKP